MKKFLSTGMFTILFAILFAMCFSAFAEETNFIANGNFENLQNDTELQSLFGSYYKNAKVSLVSEDGNKALKVIQQSNYANATYLTDIPLELDKTYQLEFDIKIIGETESGAEIDKVDVNSDMMFADSKGIGKISHIIGKVNGGTKSGWLHYSGNYSVSKDTIGEDAFTGNTFHAAKLSFYSNPVNNKPITFYVDNLVFKEIVKPITIVVIGNSILNHGQSADLGWYGNYGMAASAEDKDYFHLLKDAHVGTQFGEISWNKLGIASTEKSIVAEDNHDYSELFETNIFSQVRKIKPDVLILQIGENVSAAGLTASQYEDALTQMIDGFLKINPDMQVILSTGFWGGTAKVAGAKAAAAKAGFPCADLATLNTAENKAGSLFANSGVAMHPGDTGMANIANLFYEKLQPILNSLVYKREGIKFAPVNQFTESTFTDIRMQDWYYSEVASAYILGLINGKGNGLFDPDGEMTVAEAITLAVRLNDIDTGTKGNYSATQDGLWYDAYVTAAVDKRIIANKTSFDFDQPVTRAQMCQLFANALPESYFKKINNFTSIPDVEESSEYQKAILSFYNAGILTGVDAEYHFNPESNIKRCEVAAIITRIVDTSKRKAIS